MATKQRMVRLSFYATRKAGASEEEFQTYWSKTHGPLALGWLKRHGILKYTQYHTPQSMKETAEVAFPLLKKIKKYEYDGAGEFIMPDISCFHKAQQDPFYLTHMLPDEQKLFDWETTVYQVGWEEIYIKNGKIVDMPNGDTMALES